MLGVAAGTVFSGVGLALVVCSGLAGVTGWLRGATRRSLNEAHQATILALQQQNKALDDRVTTLESEVAACAQRDREKDGAIKVLMEQTRGTDQLRALTTQITDAVKAGGAMQSDLVNAFRVSQSEILAALQRIEYRMEVRA